MKIVAGVRTWIATHRLQAGILVFFLAVAWWLFRPMPSEPLETSSSLVVGNSAPGEPTLAIAEGWELYWQNPRDQQPTIVHNACPTGDGTATRLRIQPSQAFALSPAECAPYQGREVVRVQLQTDEGPIEGFAVKFDSFEPYAANEANEASRNSPQLRTVGEETPLMIDYRNYDPSFGSAFVYAWYTEASISGQGEAGLRRQLAELAALPNEGLTKMLMVSSVSRLEQLLRDERQALEQSGITVIGYNTERAVGTPDGEMNALRDASPSNPVARAATLAEGAGLDLIWGPLRQTVDALPDGVIQAMVEGGLDGVALQEQKRIESQPVAERVRAVIETAARYRRIGGEGFHVSVQIMPSRCPSSAVCSEFVAQIEPSIDSIAIWASGQADRAALPQLVASMDARGG